MLLLPTVIYKDVSQFSKKWRRENMKTYVRFPQRWSRNTCDRFIGICEGISRLACLPWKFFLIVKQTWHKFCPESKVPWSWVNSFTPKPTLVLDLKDCFPRPSYMHMILDTSTLLDTLKVSNFRSHIISSPVTTNCK